MKRTITILEDDLDGSEGSETVPFALDGVEYAIDLNEAHAKELRKALGRFTRAARKAGGQARTPPARRSHIPVWSRHCQGSPAVGAQPGPSGQ